MATLVQTKTFKDILSAVIKRGKIASTYESLETNDSATLNTLKQFVNERYDEVVFAKKWPWREDTRDIVTTTKVTAGTASVTNGQREVTLSTGTLDDTWEGRYFRVSADQEYYEIISVNDAANRKFLISSPYHGTTTAAASYTIWRNKYGLFPDYADIINVIPSGTTSILSPKPLTEMTTEEMSNLQALYPFRETQYPTHYSIGDNLAYDGPPMGNNFIMGYDFMGAPETPSLIFFPNIFDSQVIHIKYGLILVKLVETTDEPIIPIDKRKVLTYGALSDWYSVQGKENLSEYYEKKYEGYLGKMKADFDRTEQTFQLKVRRPGKRRLSTYPRLYPEND